MKKLLLDILKNITAEFPEVFEVLEMRVDKYRIDLDVFVDKEISQAGHRFNFFSKRLRYDAMACQAMYRFFILVYPWPFILCNKIVGDIKEALYANL